MGSIISAIEEKKAEKQYKKDKAYLVALASCIRDTEPGSRKHHEILWVINNRDKIRKCKNLIELIES